MPARERVLPARPVPAPVPVIGISYENTCDLKLSGNEVYYTLLKYY